MQAYYFGIPVTVIASMETYSLVLYGQNNIIVETKDLSRRCGYPPNKLEVK